MMYAVLGIFLLFTASASMQQTFALILNANITSIRRLGIKLQNADRFYRHNTTIGWGRISEAGRQDFIPGRVWRLEKQSLRLFKPRAQRLWMGALKRLTRDADIDLASMQYTVQDESTVAACYPAQASGEMGCHRQLVTF